MTKSKNEKKDLTEKEKKPATLRIKAGYNLYTALLDLPKNPSEIDSTELLSWKKAEF